MAAQQAENLRWFLRDLPTITTMSANGTPAVTDGLAGKPNVLMSGPSQGGRNHPSNTAETSSGSDLIEEDENEEPSTGFPRHMPSDVSNTLEKLDPKLNESYDRAFRSELRLVQKRDELKDAMKKIPKDDDFTFNHDLKTIKPELAEKANNVRGAKVNMKAINLQLVTVHQLMATFKQQQDATIAKIEAEELLKEAEELREKAKELTEKRKLFNDLVEGTLSLTKLAVLPEGELFKLPGRIELLTAAFHTTNDLAENYHKGIYATIEALEQQADENVKKARNQRLDALKKEANAFEEARRNLDDTFTVAIQTMDDALAVVKTAQSHFEDEYDRKSTSTFKFAPLVKALGMSRNILMKLVPEVRKVTDDAFGHYYRIRKSRSVPEAIREDLIAWRSESNDIRRWAEEQQEDLTIFYDAVTAAIATSRDRPSES
jgi:hypothetical protein